MAGALMAVKRLKFFFIIGTLLIGSLANALGANQAYNTYQTDQPPILDGRLDDVCWESA